MSRRYNALRHERPAFGLADIVLLLGASAFILLIALIGLIAMATWRPAHATWKPEYGQSPAEVQRWFRAQTVNPAARPRLNGLTGCCDGPERLRTKFEPVGTNEWAYYPDPACTAKGCPLLPIPNDIVHEEPIHMLDRAADNLPEAHAMRREGVLFIWQGKPTCFWPPEGGI